jgi:class 3 adenylate cyclase
MIVIAEEADEIGQLRRVFPELPAILLSSWIEGELVTRIEEVTALPDRTTGEPDPLASFICGEKCLLDLAGHVFRGADGREVTLTRGESDLMRELARSPCQVVSRDKLRRVVTGRGADPFDRSIDMLVARLRRKIEPDPKIPQILVTAPGVGYRLVARRLSADGQQSTTPSTEPERRQVTALSCKLVGALKLARNLDPEDLFQITRNFQEAGVFAITQMGGTIGTLSPDEILAFFGYPDAREDDAERAVTAGFDALARIGRLVSPSSVPLQARVAIATGLALAGPKQAVGQPSIIAESVCDLAAPNWVLVSASTRRLLGEAFICQEVEQHALAGVSERVSVYRVMARCAAACHFKAKHP